MEIPAVTLNQDFDDEDVTNFITHYTINYRKLSLWHTVKSSSSLVQYKSFDLQCEGFGEFKSRAVTDRQPTNVKKCDCTFRLRVTINKTTGLYKINKKKTCYNHNLKCKRIVAAKKGEYLKLQSFFFFSIY